MSTKDFYDLPEIIFNVEICTASSPQRIVVHLTIQRKDSTQVVSKAEDTALVLLSPRGSAYAVVRNAVPQLATNQPYDIVHNIRKAIFAIKLHVQNTSQP